MFGEARDLVYHYWLWLCVALAVGALFWVRRVLRRTPKTLEVRDVTMTYEGRKLHVKRVVFNAIMDGVLEATLNGDINEQEANDVLGLIAKTLHHEELMPLIRIRKTAIAKSVMKHNKRRREVHGKDLPLPIPTEKDVKTLPPVDTSDAAKLSAILSAA